METTYFYEEQSFRNGWIFFLALILCIILFSIMAYGLISQVFYNIPFGSHPVSNSGMWGIAVFGTLMTIGIPLLIYKSKLTIKVTSEGFYFRYFPFHIRYRKIDFSTIENEELKEFNALKEYGGWGIRKKILKNETAYIVRGNKGIAFTYKNGKKIITGTQRPDELLQAINRIK